MTIPMQPWSSEKSWAEVGMDSFREAAADYKILMDRGYPENASLKLVGDRRRLTSEERVILYRGICSTEKASSRRAKILPFPSSRTNLCLVIDGYNVLFTLMNYRLGKRLFLCSDGYLRDSGGVQGRIKNESVFEEISNLLLDFPGLRQFPEIRIFFDSPVSFSARHSQFLESGMEERGLSGFCATSPSADFEVKQACLLAPDTCLPATSDSAVIDAVPWKVLDLARWIIETNWQSTFMDLGRQERI